MNKTDITMYSDSELSLIVFNEEWLYKMRHYGRKGFISILDEYYIYTQAQLDELENDLEQELSEV
jgi:hypothetical protein